MFNECYDKKRMDKAKAVKATLYRHKMPYTEEPEVTLEMLSDANDGPKLYEEAERNLLEKQHDYDPKKELCELLFTAI